jgi:purine nucleosidase
VIPTFTPARRGSTRLDYCLALVLLISTVTPLTAPVHEASRNSIDIRVIIDNDPGFEDYIGTLMALQWPRVKVEALTIVPGVIPDPYIAATNDLKFLEYVGREDIPVAVGMNKPLKGDVFFPKDESDRYIHFWDSYPTPRQKILQTDAVDLIISRIMSSPGEITLVAAGPLTNIAAAIMREPQIVKNVKKIVIMGGTTLPYVDDTSYVPGTSRVAEFNIFTDPEAANIVFGSGAEIVMVGLNVTVKLFLTPDLLEQIRQLKNRATNLLEPMLAHTSLTPLWDTLTIAISIDPYLVTTQRSRVEVVLENDQGQRGRTLVFKDADGNVNVSMDVDIARVKPLIVDLLSKYDTASTTYIATPQSTTRSDVYTSKSVTNSVDTQLESRWSTFLLATAALTCLFIVILVGMFRQRRGASRICFSCRTVNKRTARFCRRCGVRLR